MPTGNVRSENQLESDISSHIKGNIVDAQKTTAQDVRTLLGNIKRTLFYWVGELQTLISGKANASHTHNASDINAGELHPSRIPNLDASKITSGVFDIARIPDASTLGGYSLSQVLDRANHTGTQAQSTVTNLVSDLANKANNTSLNEVIQSGSSYPDATTLQTIRNSIIFLGKDYPAQKRMTDIWYKLPAPPVFQSITGLTSSAFTYNYLAGTFTNQDGNPETQLANRYRVQISTSPTMSGAQEYTTTALFYAFTGLTQPTYYVRVRAEVFIDGGYEFSDWSNIQQVNVVSDPYLALNPVMYLDGTSLNDLGSYGGTWIEVGGTVDFVGGRINLDNNEYLRRTFTPGIQLNNTSTDNYFIVLKLRMDTTSTSNIAFLQLADVVFASGSFFGVATLNTADVRLERSGANGGTLTNVRTGNEIKVVIRSLGNSTFECWVNPTVGGETTDTKITVSKSSTSVIAENISIGGRLSGTQAKANGIPYINKFALYRGTLPTYDQIAALP